MRELSGRFSDLWSLGSRRNRDTDAAANKRSNIAQPEPSMPALSPEIDPIPAASAAAPIPAPWSLADHWPAAAVLLTVLGVLAAYWSTAVSIVAIWERSETFAHGFVVIPICIWLVWRRREELAHIPAEPWWPALIGVVLAGALWLVAASADALGVKQFALAFLIQTGIVTVLGKRLSRALVFPLVFLLFAIPAGDVFVPTLIDWTADFTVAALRFSGVPVYREANHFIIPSGAWSVVEACSGIRYIIASVMVGTIYAAVAYRSTKRRIAFLVASALVPIVANWLRAYMIVMIGHLSNNRLAVGVDHIIYGWIFFGIVMLLLFWVGSRWQEADAPLVATGGEGASAALMPEAGSRNGGSRLFAAAIAVIILAAIWPPIDGILARGTVTNAPTLAPIEAGNGWVPSTAPVAGWRPHYSGYAADSSQRFQKDGHTVELYLAYFRDQSKGHELITSGNVLVAKIDFRWKEVATGTDNVDWNGTTTPASTAEISGPRVVLDVYRLYWINGAVTSNEYVAKLLTAWSKLRGRGDDSALILAYVPQSTEGQDMGPVLRDFVAASAPSIERSLEAARVSGQAAK
jgi:exosortase A